MNLGVNIDHVATLREVRKGIEPEPAFAALIAQGAGADSIVAHLREDRRHIKERDLYILKEVVKVKLNLEMSVAGDIVKIACKVKPQRTTLVPEKRREITTEGGLDVASHFKKIHAAFDKLRNKGIEVSLFIDPDKKQIDAARNIGIEMIELHTGRYANAVGAREQNRYLRELEAATSYAKEGGLQVFAGHGLNYHNVAGIIAIKDIEELNIGYSIVCRAVLVGFERAVREMKALINVKI